MNVHLQVSVLLTILFGFVSCKDADPAKPKKEPATTTTATAEEAPKTVAVEKVESATTGGYATVNLQRLVRESKAGIAGSQRVDAYKAQMKEALAKRKAYPSKIMAEMEIIQQQLKTTQPGSADQKKWAGMFESTKAELTALAKDQEEFAKRRDQQLKEYSLAEIKRVISFASAQLGVLTKERGYIWLMDRSGLGSNDVPVILYTKEKHPDVTSEILLRMDKAFSEATMEK